MPIAVIGSFRVPPARIEEFRSPMRKAIELSRAEPGCIAYCYAEDVIEPGLIRVSEIWTSRECLDAHLRAPHMAEWRREREALGMSDRLLTLYTASNPESL